MILNYDMIRPDILESLKRYIDQGIPTGGFLSAVLENNLSEAFGRADEHNCETLFHICGFIYNEIPRAAWGSEAKVKAWLEQKRKTVEAKS